MEISTNLPFQVILQVDLRWLLILISDLLTTWTWRFPYYIYKPSLVPIGLQTFQMRPLSHFQPIIQLDLRWPLTLMWPLTSSTNEGSCVASIYVPTLVDIHQSMWKIEPNVNLSSQQQTRRQQRWTKWSLSCVFPAMAGDTHTQNPV